MKKFFSLAPKRMAMILSLLILASLSLWSANTKKSIIKVNDYVTIDTDVDYTITSANPFGDEGVVNIVNTEHAVVILSSVKPSAALKLLASHVQINGEKAVNNSNCQVKLYNRGCIILPYGNTMKPLTVYSEQNFEGESCNDFGLENTGGFMNTLTDAKLNNRIRSFKLKRGYMVTFSLRAGGRGYSRCFIAAYEDLEVPTLPAVMDQKISSYRVFKWYDTGKQQLAAAGGDKDACSALNVTSTYTWGTTSDMSPDVENVPHHIYENYPSPGALGACTTSPHMKTNNEPMNTADDPKGKTESVDEVLANWEDLMRTGMRLCSPSSWDGSDYTNGTGYIKRFIDSIDARGWRCDIIDLHCYWPEGNFGTIRNWTNSTGRPVWISEWVWGASWNSNGAFANGVTEAQNAAALKRICSTLNNNDCIERYYYWNGERDPSRIYKNGNLTEAGEYYATINSGVGYNGKYDFVPTTPKQYGLSNYSKTVADGKTTLSWYDPNGEFNQLMEIEKKDETGLWTQFAVIEQKEEPSKYTYVIDSDDETIDYRVHMIDLNGKEYYTQDEKSVGDLIDIDGNSFYAGGNVILNGDFDMGFSGWTNGVGNELAEPDFQIVRQGGYRGGAYLQAYNSGTADKESSVRTVVPVQPQSYYYFSAADANTNSINTKVSLSVDGTTESEVVASLKTSTTWEHQSTTFNTGTYDKFLMSFRLLAAKGQLDKFELRRLFASQEEAIQDGILCAKNKAEMLKTYNTICPRLNAELDNIVAEVTGTGFESLREVENAIANLQQAMELTPFVDSVRNVLQSIADEKCIGYDQMMELVDDASNTLVAEDLISDVAQLKALLQQGLNFSAASVQPKNPSFAATSGWQTVTGTYTGGDQRTNTVNGKTCWNAWWSVSKASNPNATMEVRQTVSGLEAGMYVLECKATTEHFCLSDQHGFLTYNDKTINTPTLTYDYFDLPVSNIWETLTTSPIYVEEGGEVTIGFLSSKDGATDGKWHRIGQTAAGDNREGWWCATDFVLKFIPLYKSQVVANQFGVICLPYAIRPSEGMKFYQIVGINASYDKLCLEEIESAEAGVPCIYRSEKEDVIFYEYGTAVTKTTDAPGNIRGFLKTTANVPVGYYYVSEGGFVRCSDSSSRPAIGNYTGIMRPFTDNASLPFAVIENWEGETMDITGVTEDEINFNNEIVTSIPSISVSFAEDGIYSIDGRKVSTTADGLKAGLYIKVVDGRAYKTILN